MYPFQLLKVAVAVMAIAGAYCRILPLATADCNEDTVSHCGHVVQSAVNATCSVPASVPSSPFEVQAVKDAFSILGVVSAIIAIFICSRKGVATVRTWWYRRNVDIQLPSFMFVTPWGRNRSWEQELEELPRYTIRYCSA